MQPHLCSDLVAAAGVAGTHMTAMGGGQPPLGDQAHGTAGKAGRGADCYARSVVYPDGGTAGPSGAASVTERGAVLPHVFLRTEFG